LIILLRLFYYLHKVVFRTPYVISNWYLNMSDFGTQSLFSFRKKFVCLKHARWDYKHFWFRTLSMINLTWDFLQQWQGPSPSVGWLLKTGTDPQRFSWWFLGFVTVVLKNSKTLRNPLNSILWWSISFRKSETHNNLKLWNMLDQVIASKKCSIQSLQSL
jgi:hypothetical protein